MRAKYACKLASLLQYFRTEPHNLGQQWEERINKSLSDVTFLIPIITPSFFKSPACRAEFTTFFLKEKLLGLNRLILPLYYVICDQFGDFYKIGSDEIVDVLKGRNWTDWRQFRFKQFSDEPVAAALAQMAATIKKTIGELDAIDDLLKAQPVPSSSKQRSTSGLPANLYPKAIYRPLAKSKLRMKARLICQI